MSLYRLSQFPQYQYIPKLFQALTATIRPSAEHFPCFTYSPSLHNMQYFLTGFHIIKYLLNILVLQFS